MGTQFTQGPAPSSSDWHPGAIKMTDEEAAAIVLATRSDTWPYVMQHIARFLVKTRDMLELSSSDRLGGFATGLRYLFEMQARAEAHAAKEKFQRSREIVGELEEIINPEEQPEE